MPPSGVRGVRCSSRRRAGDTPASSSSVGSESRSSVESAAEAKPPSKKRQQSSDIMQLPLREGLPWTCKCGEVLAARKLRSYICLLLRIFSSLRIHIEFLDLFVVRRRKRTIPLWEVQKVRACVGRWPHFADESNCATDGRVGLGPRSRKVASSGESTIHLVWLLAETTVRSPPRPRTSTGN